MIHPTPSYAQVGGELSPLTNIVTDTLTSGRARISIEKVIAGSHVQALGFNNVGHFITDLRKLSFEEVLYADDGPDSTMMALEVALSLPRNENIVIYRSGLMLIPWFINLYRPDIIRVIVLEPVKELLNLATQIWPMDHPHIQMHHADLIQFFSSTQYAQESNSIGTIVWNNNTELSYDDVLKSYYRTLELWRSTYSTKQIAFVGLRSPFGSVLWPSFISRTQLSPPTQLTDLRTLLNEPDPTPLNGLRPSTDEEKTILDQHNANDSAAYKEHDYDDDDDDDSDDDDDDDDSDDDDCDDDEADEDGEIVDAAATSPGIVTVSRSQPLEDWEKELLEE